MIIPFNKPHYTGNEMAYIATSMDSGKISGDGIFTKKCHEFFKQYYAIKTPLLTTSCTDALEMSAILLNIQPGDEVLAPSYTFVSTVNPFMLRGVKVILVDSLPDNPNIDTDLLESLITPRTKAIIVMHYAGVAVDMDKVMMLAQKYNLYIIEDAAQAIDSYYKGKLLGTIGDFGTFSFHDTKNIICGEGGLLSVNNDAFSLRSEIIREKGTNRAQFFRGEVDKYCWVDVGSSFLPSDMIAAFLWAQLEQIAAIQTRRREIWSRYAHALAPLAQKGYFTMPNIPSFSTNNAHMFYITCNSLIERSALIAHLKSRGIAAVFHYITLHDSPFFESKHDGRPMPNAQKYTDCLLRLPLFYDLKATEQDYIVAEIKYFFEQY